MRPQRDNCSRYRLNAGEQCSTTRITLDQWSSFADFSEKVGPPESGFEGYEEDGAWPLLLDEYVEQLKADAVP